MHSEMGVIKLISVRHGHTVSGLGRACTSTSAGESRNSEQSMQLRPFSVDSHYTARRDTTKYSFMFFACSNSHNVRHRQLTTKTVSLELREENILPYVPVTACRVCLLTADVKVRCFFCRVVSCRVVPCRAV
jgi:hypothetical protein